MIGVCVSLCGIFFAFSGELAFITDLKTIETYMVEPAMWIKENTQKDAVIAVHDIGAMGYWGDRKIIDLAGLIQPEIIPIIRNEQELNQYLIENEVDYLVVFEDWYDTLGNNSDLMADFRNPESDVDEVVVIKRFIP